MKRLFIIGILSFCGVTLLTPIAGAIPWQDANPAVKPGIPDIGWVSTDSNLTTGGGYCGYVAAANVLYYWDNNGYPNLVPDTTDPDALMTALIGSLDPAGTTYHRYLYQTGTIYGTSCDEVEIGLRNYFTDRGYSMIINQYNPPNISQYLIESELTRCEQVIVGTQTHWLTATGWWYEDDTTMETWLGFHDPNPLQGDGQNFGGNEDYYMTSTANWLSLLYGSWTVVDNIITISPVPEPTTIVLLCSGLVGLAGLRKKFKR